jgi:aspartyl-tRNA(Asn)/glutamyl-tRNA(Gln) amidotransferase subunit A
MSNLFDLTLCDAAEGIAEGSFSCEELVRSCIDNIETNEPTLNCFIRFDAEQALEAARRADSERQRAESIGALHGIPLAHKDMFYREGVVCTCGSKLRQDFIPPMTATVLERLDHEGALHIGALNMAEFAFSPTGHNHHYGAVHNPWDPERVSGGSSSGSGGAVAARFVFGAFGSDTGGSVRLPAAACGVVGIKPTQTRISRYGMMGLSFSLDNAGPLARTVRDAARLLEAVAGHDPLDDTSARHAVGRYEASALEPEIAGLRIGRPINHYYDVIAPSIRSAMEASLAKFEALGAHVVDVEVPFHDELGHLANLIQGTESAAIHHQWLVEQPGDYGPQVRARIEPGLAFPTNLYLRAVQLRPKIIERFVQDVFGKCDVLHLPAIPVELPTITESDVGDSPGFHRVLGRISRCTFPMNYLSLPSMSVPAGFTDDGLPIGFQLAGRPFSESRLIGAAAAYEAETRWHERRPGLLGV